MHTVKTICFFTLLITLIVQGCKDESSPPPQAPAQEKYAGTIAAVGDSLTEGLGVAEEFAYPALLAQKLQDQGYRYRVVNAGISGETSSGTLARIKWVLTLKPDIVILVIGANDGLRGIDPGLIESNLRRIIQALKAENVIVVLGGMRIVQNLGPTYTSAFAAVYPKIAESEKVIFIPFFLNGVAADPALNQSDGIHPTAEGYRKIVAHIYPYVTRAIENHRETVLPPPQ